MHLSATGVVQVAAALVIGADFAVYLCLKPSPTRKGTACDGSRQVTHQTILQMLQVWLTKNACVTYRGAATLPGNWLANTKHWYTPDRDTVSRSTKR